MGNPAWVTAAIALGTVVVTGIGFCVRWFFRLLMRIVRLVDDYLGEPAREGVEARPGVMARIQSVEKSVAHVVAETSPNHGHSIRDTVHRTANDVADVKNDVAQLDRKVSNLAGRMELFERQRAGREDESP